MFDQGTNSWSQVADLNVGRSSFGMVNFNGIVYAVGGVSSAGFLTSVEQYDSKTNKWISLPNGLKTARWNHQVYVVSW